MVQMNNSRPRGIEEILPRAFLMVCICCVDVIEDLWWIRPQSLSRPTDRTGRGANQDQCRSGWARMRAWVGVGAQGCRGMLQT